MSHGNLSRRAVLSLVVLLAAAVLSKCMPLASPDGHRGALVDCADCANGIGSNDENHPFICVDTEAKVAHPKRVTVNCREGRPGHSTGKPVLVRWGTSTNSGTIDINFTDTGCVKDDVIKCSFPTPCQTVVLEQKVAKSCTYQIKWNGITIDPVIDVNPCCP